MSMCKSQPHLAMPVTPIEYGRFPVPVHRFGAVSPRSTSRLDGCRWTTAIVCSMVMSCAAATTQSRPATPFAAVAGPIIIAHRGGSLEAPENTLAAIRHGVEVGADWQEVDLRLTGDGEVVLFHDDTLVRTTDGKGPIEQATLAALKRLNAGSPKWSKSSLERLQSAGVEPVEFNGRFSGEKIPTLDEALAVEGTRLMLELKTTERGGPLVRQVVERVRRANAYDRVAVASFEGGLLWATRDLEPSLPLIGLAREQRQVDEMLGLPIAVLAVRCEVADYALQVSPAGVAVWCWTIYSVEMAEKALELGVHGLITDVPAKVVQAVRTLPDPVMRLSE